jgi:hypothetical protein
MITDEQWVEMGFDPKDPHDWPIMCVVEREVSTKEDFDDA